MDNRITDQVFNNPYLLAEILFHSFTDIVGDMKLRLVNKSFNNAHLMATKLEFRKMTIKYRDDDDDWSCEMAGYFYFNGRKLNRTKMCSFLKYLNNVVHLKVEELMIRDFRLRRNAAMDFHDKVHTNLIANNRNSIRKLIGLEDICDGCEKCLEAAKTVREYGPIRFDSLRKLQKADSPRTLIITDKLLEEIANHCVSISSSREECLEEVCKCINPLLPQPHLILYICEDRDAGRQEHPTPSDIPLEVLEMFCKSWNVESIEIRFIYHYYPSFSDIGWIQSQYFTRFRFNDTKISVIRSLFPLTYVTVDLTESYYCARDFETDRSGEQRGYENLLLNVQKVFTTNQIYVKNFYIFGPSLQIIELNLNQLMLIVRKVEQPGMRITIEVLTQITSFEELNANAETDGALKFPENLIFMSPTFYSCRCDVFDYPNHCPEGQRMMGWIGRQLQINDNNSQVELKIDLYLNEYIFNHGRPEEAIHKNVKELFALFK